MDNSVKITLIIVGAIVLLAILGYFAFTGMLPTNTVSASGQSQIEVMPDLVSIYINVQADGDTSKEASDKAEEIADNFISSLVKYGFERKDIVTQSFSVNPKYDWSNGKNEMIGYTAVHQFKVEFDAERIDKIGTVVDAAVNAGASVNYINFELSREKQNEYKIQALKQATEDARLKAEGMAAGLNKRLGDVYSVSSSNFDYQPWRMYDAVTAGNVAEAKSAITSIQPGNEDVNAYVTVAFKLK